MKTERCNNQYDHHCSTLHDFTVVPTTECHSRAILKKKSNYNALNVILRKRTDEKIVVVMQFDCEFFRQIITLAVYIITKSSLKISQALHSRWATFCLVQFSFWSSVQRFVSIARKKKNQKRIIANAKWTVCQRCSQGSSM